LTGAQASWSFGEADAEKMRAVLAGFLRESGARTALIVDRSGQLVATVGEAPAFDPTAFASLTAADFSANDQLAKLKDNGGLEKISQKWFGGEPCVLH